MKQTNLSTSKGNSKHYLLFFSSLLIVGFSNGEKFSMQNLKQEIFDAPYFQNPLGDIYMPHILRDGDTVIEDTFYAVHNPDLPGTSACFGEDMAALSHAG